MQLKGISLLILALMIAGECFIASAQHDMHKMSGNKMSNTGSNKKSTGKRKKRSRRHNMANMKGKNMRGMSGRHKHVSKKQTAGASQTKTKHQVNNMPRMNMQQPTASPATLPQQKEMNMPGMQMPSASPQASPQPRMEMNMPMPAASPSASPQHPHMPGMNMPTPSASPMAQMPGMESGAMNMHMDMGPLMVMSGNDMEVRVGASDTNLMSMGAMGSGTSWQPSSGPMHMHYWNKNDWLLMFHYNLIAGVNRQGGPRGVTKFESQNWFMPMAYHKLGKGTLQLRGMFSA